MGRYEKREVITSWKCSTIDKEVATSEEAVYHDVYGWICDCLSWTSGDDSNHKPRVRDIRFVYVPDTKDTASTTRT